MKVKEAIEILKTMDPEAKVVPSMFMDEDKDNKIGYAVCPECGETVILADCETDQYFTNDGDRCVYHLCSECGEPIETIDLVNGNRMLEE